MGFLGGGCLRFVRLYDCLSRSTQDDLAFFLVIIKTIQYILQVVNDYYIYKTKSKGSAKSPYFVPMLI